MRADALKLSEVFGPSCVDIVYGLSVIEHIPSPCVFLDQVHKVLRPGGLASLEGSPIWSSPKGHHVWVAEWGGAYSGKTTVNYLFSPIPGKTSTNQLPDWVYSSPEINRLTMADIAAVYGHSQLIVLEANALRSDVPQDVQVALRQRHGPGIDYGVASMTCVLAKPLS